MSRSQPSMQRPLECVTVEMGSPGESLTPLPVPTQTSHSGCLSSLYTVSALNVLGFGTWPTGLGEHALSSLLGQILPRARTKVWGENAIEHLSLFLGTSCSMTIKLSLGYYRPKIFNLHLQSLPTLHLPFFFPSCRLCFSVYASPIREKPLSLVRQTLQQSVALCVLALHTALSIFPLICSSFLHSFCICFS